ncbi:unnamed protein product [Gongylonema pulchrum]|uniref:Uncharacterized protein n=1 Tax=Gongylonema pulchrum TaxID=637853 RepID=A0A183DMG4_9BILA|nr:unnamed protein product [Gongylonema pulchrum]
MSAWRSFSGLVYASKSCYRFVCFAAIRVFKQIDEVGFVWSLEEIRFIEERNLLAGHLALLLDKFDIAEGFFLQSSRPLEALDVNAARSFALGKGTAFGNTLGTATSTNDFKGIRTTTRVHVGFV